MKRRALLLGRERLRGADQFLEGILFLRGKCRRGEGDQKKCGAEFHEWDERAGLPTARHAESQVKAWVARRE